MRLTESVELDLSERHGGELKHVCEERNVGGPTVLLAYRTYRALDGALHLQGLVDRHRRSTSNLGQFDVLAQCLFDGSPIHKRGRHGVLHCHSHRLENRDVLW